MWIQQGCVRESEQSPRERVNVDIVLWAIGIAPLSPEIDWRIGNRSLETVEGFCKGPNVKRFKPQNGGQKGERGAGEEEVLVAQNSLMLAL